MLLSKKIKKMKNYFNTLKKIKKFIDNNNKYKPDRTLFLM